jgi:hypothetical protein
MNRVDSLLPNKQIFSVSINTDALAGFPIRALRQLDASPMDRVSRIVCVYIAWCPSCALTTPPALAEFHEFVRDVSHF